ncbi:MAG: amidohydrolase family protein [Paenibacillaceae bacterium]|nr:amidohydrolase family protein [Paenibacillaceae bacterium]
MIIDSHLHLFFSAEQAWRPQAEKLLRDMERAGIGQTCLMPNPQFDGCIYPSREALLFQAETLAAAAAAYPGRFLPLLFVCPMQPHAFTLELIERYVTNGPLVGIKFHISLPADDERYEPIYDYLERHDIPLLFHSWYKTTMRATFESSPAQIAAMAARHPKLRVLMAHLTGAKLRGIADIKPYPNVLLDTSGSQPEEGYLQRAIEELGAERVLYGSDYPIRSFATQLARIDSADLTQGQRELVLYRNARQFFRKGAIG